MKKVLIYKDDASISKFLEGLNSIQNYCQQLYDAFAAISIEMDIDEIVKLISNKQAPQVKDFDIAEDIVKEKIVSKMDEKSWQGVVYLDKAKLKELVKVPDVSEIKRLLNAHNSVVDWASGFGWRIAKMHLVEIKNGKVVKTSGAEEAIRNMHTHYSQTEDGALITESLHKLCFTLNEWKQLSAKHRGTHTDDPAKDLPYVEVRSGEFYPSLSYIRRYENIALK